MSLSACRRIRRWSPNLGSQRAIGRDPPPGNALKGVEPLQRHVRLAPGEVALADEQERVGEIVECGPELLDGREQFLGRQAALAVLNGRNRLPILKTKNAREVVLGELPLLPKGLEADTDEEGHT